MEPFLLYPSELGPGDVPLSLEGVDELRSTFERWLELPAGGSKKAGDVFTDAKVPLCFRPVWAVLAAAATSGFWLGGAALDLRTHADDSIRDHDVLIGYLKNRDEAAAVKLTTSHIQRFRKHVADYTTPTLLEQSVVG